VTGILQPAVPWERLRDASHSRDAVQAVLALIMYPSQWIHRRIETVTFVDDSTVRRRVSLDFTVPACAPVLDTGAAAPRLLPVASFEKASLMNFDLHDEQASSLFLLSASQNAAVSLQVLLHLARGHLQAAPHPLIDNWLRTLVLHTPDDTREARKSVIDDPGAFQQFRELRSRSVFRGLSDELARNFLLYAVVGDEPGTRRILKYSADAPLGSVLAGESKWHRKVQAWFGLRPGVLRIPCGNASAVHSFHFELSPPAGVFVTEGWLGTPIPATAETKLRVQDHCERVEGRLHMHVRDLPLGTPLLAQVKILPAHLGWLTGVLSATLVTFAIVLMTGIGVLRSAAPALQTSADRAGALAVIAIFSGRLPEGQQAADPAVAVLLSITAVFVTVLGRTEAHQLVARVVRGVRLLATVSAVIPAIASVMVVFGWAGSIKAWLVLWALSFGSFGLVLASWLHARANGPKTAGSAGTAYTVEV